MSVLLAARRGQAKKQPDWRALAREFAERFQQDECPMRAAALAFTGVFSLIPLLLLGLAILGFLLPEPGQATEYLAKFLSQMMPGQSAQRALREILQQINLEEAVQGLLKGSVWALLFGLISQVWVGTSLFVTAATPMNAAWDVTETRSFLRLRLVGLSVFAGAAALFLLSLLPSAGPDFVRRLHIPWLGLPEHVPFWVEALFMLLALAIDVGMFVLIYRFLPNTKVPWRVALIGGAIAGLLWELFKKGFAVYLSHFGNFNKLYGAFGGIALLVTWIWYSCIVLLAGAILCKMFYEYWIENGVKRRAGP